MLASARPETDASAVLATIRDITLRENRAAAERLTAIGELYAVRFADRDETSDRWAVDTERAVAVELGAALNISAAAAGLQVRLARGLRERLPLVAEVFRTGALSVAVIDTLLHRTDLITDPHILAAVDAALAGSAARLTALSYGQLCGHLDRLIAGRDRDAVRRRQKARDRREVWVSDSLDGTSDFGGTMTTADAIIMDRRLDALAAAVCADDPRTTRQRRADALAALTAGADRLACQCGAQACPTRNPDTATATATAAPGVSVVVHVVTGPAETDMEAAAADTVTTLVRNDAVLPPEQVAQLTAHATVRPVSHPGTSEPEPRYTPSRALAEFVRCRDLTCRFPGCDVPAWDCDLDHTIAYHRGGPTQASNLAALCRLHHLVKTFWGWTYHQDSRATITWTSPTGDTYTTTPGSAVLIPRLCAPTAPTAVTTTASHTTGERTAKMPTRKRTRAQNRAARITAERLANHDHRQARHRAHRAATRAMLRPPPPSPDDEPPPF